MDIPTINIRSAKTTMVDGQEEQHLFKWKIVNFESITDPECSGTHPPSKINARIVTGGSEDRKSLWVVHLYVNYVKYIQTGDKTVPHLSFHLDKTKVTKLVSKVMGNFSLITSEGTRANPRTFEYCDGKDWVLHPLELFMSRADLLGDKKKFLKNGTLTILCEMRIWYDYSLREFCTVGSTYVDKLDMSKFIGDIKGLLQSSRCCDVTLRCDGVELKAHKAILSARSPVFSSMFEHDMLESKTNIVDIEDVSDSTMEKLLGFMYGQDFGSLTSETYADLYVAAEKYEILELKQMCSHSLSLHLSVENVCNVAVLADLYNDPKLFTAAEKFVNQHISELIISKEWLSLGMKNYEVAKRLVS